MDGRLSACMLVGLAGLVAETPVTAMAATHIASRQIVIEGNQNFDATGINDDGSIVGTLYEAITDAPSGLLITADAVTTIPAPYAGGGSAHPTSIHNDGTIVGWSDAVLALPTMFVIRGGTVDPADKILLEEPNDASSFASVNPLGLVGNRVFFTRIIGLSEPSDGEYGLPQSLMTVPRLNRFTTVRGLSPSGVVSGTAYNLAGPQSVFLGKGQQFQLLSPPGSTSASGGVMNASSMVAGSYLDSSRAAHGFVYAGGRYATFDMPGTTYQIDVAAISDTGRVVGSYVSYPDNKQHAFLYNGDEVASIGTFDPTVSLSEAVNNKGQMLVSEQFEDGDPKFLSFLETCSGSGC